MRLVVVIIYTRPSAKGSGDLPHLQGYGRFRITVDYGCIDLGDEGTAQAVPVRRGGPAALQAHCILLQGGTVGVR